MEERRNKYFDIDLFSEDNPKAVINLVSKKFAEAMKQVPQKLLNLSEKTLAEAIKPNEKTRRLRHTFWAEYSMVMQKNSPKMKMANVYAPVCGPDYFFKRISEDPNLVAWILLPPQEFEVVVTEAAEFGMERIRKEILQAPLYKDNGQFDTKTAALVVEVTKFLTLRAHGAVTQKTMNLNLNKNQEIPGSSENNLTDVTDIDARIRELEAGLKGKGSSYGSLVTIPEKVDSVIDIDLEVDEPKQLEKLVGKREDTSGD